MPVTVTRENEARTRAAELYALAPDGFIAGRDALVGELADAGETELAAGVKELRKPSIVAWAVNVVARDRPADVQALLKAGDALRRAQQAAVSGSGDVDLREATQERRKIIAELTDAAAAALGGRGRTHRDAIASTFEAASLELELGARLRDGTLDREATPGTGLGLPEGWQLIPGGATEGDDGRSQAKAARRAQAHESERAAAAAERDAERAARRAEQLRDKALEAVAAADTAEAEARRLADEARSQRRRATRAHRE